MCAFRDPKKRARFRTQKWCRNSRFSSPASKFVAPFLGPWSGRPPVRKVRAGRRQVTLIIQCFFALGCEDAGFTVYIYGSVNVFSHREKNVINCVSKWNMMRTPMVKLCFVHTFNSFPMFPISFPQFFHHFQVSNAEFPISNQGSGAGCHPAALRRHRLDTDVGGGESEGGDVQ